MSDPRHEGHGLEALEVAEEYIGRVIERMKSGKLDSEELSAIIDAATDRDDPVVGPDLNDPAATPSPEIRALVAENETARDADERRLINRKINLATLRLIGQLAANVTTAVAMLPL